ncbi:hypothetical protein DKX38_015414 [Salix brachista]|uniref:Uncharacterized protein n=1 Tax=Salix brachista TaxID=2182728 RepID=A0A5N5L6Y7_9ROSI|nr:hypothetical protein DKX38_015414 [Salix brachista]
MSRACKLLRFFVFSSLQFGFAEGFGQRTHLPYKSSAFPTRTISIAQASFLFSLANRPENPSPQIPQRRATTSHLPFSPAQPPPIAREPISLTNPSASPLLPCETISHLPSSPLCSSAAHCRQDPSAPKIAGPIELLSLTLCSSVSLTAAPAFHHRRSHHLCNRS